MYVVGILYRLQEEGDGSVEVNPMTIFHAAMVNAKPTIGTTRVTLGGKHYHVSTWYYNILQTVKVLS